MSNHSTTTKFTSGFPLLLLCLCGGVLAGVVYSQDTPEKSRVADTGGLMNSHRLGKLLKQHFPAAPFQHNGAGMWMIQVDADPDEKAVSENEENSTTEKNGAVTDEGEEGAAPDIMNGMMLVMTDEQANRMRIMMPIKTFDPGNAEDLKTALIALHANYDRALDARYAVSEGILWSAFIHPLGSLTEDDLDSAIEQVRTLRKNTGTSYSSGALQFAPRPAEQPDEDADEPPGDPTV